MMVLFGCGKEEISLLDKEQWYGKEDTVSLKFRSLNYIQKAEVNQDLKEEDIIFYIQYWKKEPHVSSSTFKS